MAGPCLSLRLLCALTNLRLHEKASKCSPETPPGGVPGKRCSHKTLKVTVNQKNESLNPKTLIKQPK